MKVPLWHTESDREKAFSTISTAERESRRWITHSTVVPILDCNFYTFCELTTHFSILWYSKYSLFFSCSWYVLFSCALSSATKFSLLSEELVWKLQVEEDKHTHVTSRLPEYISVTKERPLLTRKTAQLRCFLSDRILRLEVLPVD